MTVPLRRTPFCSAGRGLLSAAISRGASEVGDCSYGSFSEGGEEGYGGAFDALKLLLELELAGLDTRSALHSSCSWWVVLTEVGR